MSKDAELKKATAQRTLRVTVVVFVFLCGVLVMLALSGHAGYDDEASFRPVTATKRTREDFKQALDDLSASRLEARRRRKDQMRREQAQEAAAREGIPGELDRLEGKEEEGGGPGGSSSSDELRGHHRVRQQRAHGDHSHNLGFGHGFDVMTDLGKGGPPGNTLLRNGRGKKEEEEQEKHSFDIGDEGDSELQRVWKRERQRQQQRADEAAEEGDETFEEDDAAAIAAAGHKAGMPKLRDHGVMDWDGFEDAPDGARDDGHAERDAAIAKALEWQAKRREKAAKELADMSPDDDGESPGGEGDNGKPHPIDSFADEVALVPNMEAPKFKDIGGRGAGSEGDAQLAGNKACTVDIAEINSWVPSHPVQSALGREFESCVSKQSAPATFKSEAGPDNRVEWLFTETPSPYTESVVSALKVIGGAERNGCLGSSKLQSIIDDKTFKFAFVQDPWERFVETYMSIGVADGRLEAEALDESLANERLMATISELTVDRDGRGIDRRYLPQVFYLSDYDGKLLDFDFIGRVERFQQDFAEAIHRIRGPLDQTDPPALPAIRPLMENVHRDIVEHSVRNNAEARKRVLQHYKADALCFYGDTYDEEDI